MKLIILTRPEFFVEEDKILSSLFDEGMDVLHICKPHSEPVYAERLLTLLPEECRNKIMVHEHYYLKEEFQLRGIHISDDSESLPPNYKGFKSTTCYNIEDLREKKKEYDYVFCAHILDSISNPQKKSTFTQDMVETAAKQGLIDKKTIAMGGISINDVARMRDYGFGGICILGDLWKRFQPQSTTNYKDLIHYFRDLRRTAN